MLKLDRKTLPAGLAASSFVYHGRPAVDQDDFGSDVGIADMACVNQFGDANNNKFYHAGVVSAGSQWFVYLEWGRVKVGNSWDPNFTGGDYQFVCCSSEAEARSFFQKQCRDKNVKRLQKTDVGGKVIWASKADSDGYLVQRLATRVRGLPDAYGIKDSTGVAVAVVASTPAPVPQSMKTFDPQVVALAADLVGGTRSYARAASESTGVVPTMAAIVEVRDECLPAALQIIQRVGPDIHAQMNDSALRDLSKYVATVVPRPIPRNGDPMSILLTSNSVLDIQADLDTFESSLKGEDFSKRVVSTTQIDPDVQLNANLRWLDPTSQTGAWAARQILAMDNHRHSNFRNVRVRNVFEVSRPDRDTQFLHAVQDIASRRKGQDKGSVRPSMQPASRFDIDDIAQWADDANVFLGIHGTRGVNVAPILGSHFRLPKSLSGVQITGAAFGHGVYFATAAGKSANYCGNKASAYGSGGNINGRGYFMFLCDVVGGKFYYPKTAWGINDTCPGGADTVFAHPSHCNSLQNDEHVIFNPAMSRIRYVVELDW